ncbi:ABC-type sugar transport system permease subunit [Micromonospora profundi]|uniref:sugar ABC transporter permease n=1 Tax=Micromonospora profundi TaxID=1420889 RepID=UPI00143AE3C7|nr:sugar ABC transporter permease [Micromonospora profundi]NJC15327.1 ABC-type sugar transport system permease subunit [Micromonospora profundi]
MSTAPMSTSGPQPRFAVPPPRPPSGGVRLSRTAQIVTGLALIVPAAVALLWSYVIPSISTIVDSFGPGRLVPNRRSRASDGGLDNYREIVASGFLGDLVYVLLLALIPVLLALIVAPALALAAERAGRVPRLVTRALLAVPLAAYAPLAVGTARTMEQAGTGPGKTSAISTVALLPAGLVIAIGATVFLAVWCRRPHGRSLPAALAAGGVLALTVVAVTMQSWSLQWPVVAQRGQNRTPLLDVYQQTFVLAQTGVGAAGSAVLLVLLGTLGLLAVALLLLTRTRIAFTGWRDRPAEPTPAVRSRVALGLLVVGLLAFLGVLAYVLTPWLRLLTADVTALPRGVTAGQIQINTWLPPLISTVIGVGLAALAGFAIGGLRPLGRASELLLLPFAPWLFVGVGPLAGAHYLRARDAEQLNTFAALIPPSWLSIPALVVFTLFFRGQRERWEGSGRFISTMLLPALPMVAGAGLLTWLVAAQDWLWPRLVVAQNGLWPAPNFLLYRLRGRFDAEGTAQGDLAQILPLPMLLFFLLAFLALQLLYLDRLVILAGRQEAKPHAGAGPTGAAATGAMPAGVAASALPQTDQNDVTERDPRQS